MVNLSKRDLLALGFMTFALFVGAGNIIFPPMIGLSAGDQVWTAAAGYFITAVGMPVLAIVVLARFEGSMDKLCAPLGKLAARTLAIVCFLCIGPLFATPRTATVSFEVGVAPWLGNSPAHLFAYSALYFALVQAVSLYPGRLLDSVGRCLAPIKVAALAILGVGAFIWTAGPQGPAEPPFDTQAFSKGLTEGYLTMDTLASLVFGAVVVNALKHRGIHAPRQLFKYSVIAALIAGVGLSLVYASLFELGAHAGGLVDHADNGAQVLNAYVLHTYGAVGYWLLAFLITIACLVTAIGLTCACAEAFSKFLPLGYRTLAALLAGFSFAVSNVGLTQLIAVSVPVLTAIYLPCIAIILLSLISSRLNSPARVLIPVTACALGFGLIDACMAAGLLPPSVLLWVSQLPLANASLAWLLPSLAIFFVATVYDLYKGAKTRSSSLSPESA